MSEGQKDGDGVGEDEGDGAGGVDHWQGEYEDWEMVVRSLICWEENISKTLPWAAEVQGVEVGEADHETVERLETLPPAAEEDYEEHIANDPEDGHHQEHHSLNVELEEVGKVVVGTTGGHVIRRRGESRVRVRGSSWEKETEGREREWVWLLLPIW